MSHEKASLVWVGIGCGVWRLLFSPLSRPLTSSTADRLGFLFLSDDNLLRRNPDITCTTSPRLIVPYYGIARPHLPSPGLCTRTQILCPSRRYALMPSLLDDFFNLHSDDIPLGPRRSRQGQVGHHHLACFPPEDEETGECSNTKYDDPRALRPPLFRFMFIQYTRLAKKVF